MIRNYLASALSNLLRHRLFSLINIVGLAIGLAASILIALYVRNETSYDGHWTNAGTLYRVNTLTDATGQGATKGGVSSMLLQPALRDFFSEQIERSARIIERPMPAALGDERFTTNVSAVDPELLEMLDFDVLSGSLRQTLDDPANIALSTELASRFFGGDNPLGRTVSLGAIPRDYRVTAVYRTAPGNSVVSPHLLALIRIDESVFAPVIRSWGINNSLTLVQLREGVAPADLAAQMPAFVDQSVDIAFLNAGPEVKPSARFSFELQPLREVYLNSEFDTVMSTGNKTVVLAFSAIALLVLLIGCVNFTVLSTARATQRAKEVAVRKVVGGSRLQLLLQFVGESLSVIVPALVFALALVELLLPAISERAGVVLAIPYGEAQTWLLLCGLVLLVTLAGGLYPALVLSGFRPARTLKSGGSNEKAGSTGLRGALVVFQFSVSIALMIATAVIYAQVQFSSNRYPGFQRDNMLVIGNLGRPGIPQPQRAVLKEEILKLPSVEAAARSGHEPMQTTGLMATLSMFYARADGELAQQAIPTRSVDHDFFRAYEIPLIAGRDYAVERDNPTNLLNPGDALERSTANLIVNASAARQLGFADPDAAIGAELVADSPTTRKIVTFTIVGVVADSQFRSLRESPSPEVYVLAPLVWTNLSVNYSGNPDAVRADIEQVWRRVMGAAELELRFVDDTMAREFAQEEQEALMLVGFTGLAILIACLGLFGSAVFTVETRTKEIGIRKALGAEVRELVGMLLWQFSRPVILANVFAWPAAIWAMTRWLERFPYHLGTADIVLLAAVAGLCALLVAALAVVNSTVRVATANPLHALRYE